MKVRWVLGFALVTSSALADETALLDRVAARVDNKVIFASDVRERTRFLMTQGGDERQAGRAALDALIDEVLVAEEAGRLGLIASDDEVDRTLAVLAGNRAGLERELAKQGLSMVRFRAFVRAQLLEAKWLQMLAARRGTSAKPAELREEGVRELRGAAYVDVHR